MTLDDTLKELNHLTTDQLIPVLAVLIIVKQGHTDEVINHLEELINTRLNAEAYR